MVPTQNPLPPPRAANKIFYLKIAKPLVNLLNVSPLISCGRTNFLKPCCSLQHLIQFSGRNCKKKKKKKAKKEPM